jgi:heterodisulfide reductase subunit A
MEEPRIGVYVCWCGTNIAKMIDVETVVNVVKELEHVTVAKNYKYMCSDPGQEMIIQDIREHNLNRIVVAACSPRIHELTFRKAIENAGLNPYLFEMANIREHVSWVHDNMQMATEKAIMLVHAAITRVQYHEPLTKMKVDIDPATLVIGGGISGLSAAIMLAGAGKKVFIVEQEDRLGGLAARLDLTFPFLGSARQVMQPKIDQVMDNPFIEVFLNAEAKEIFGHVGSFKAQVYAAGEKKKEIQFGNIIVATGLSPLDPTDIPGLGYGEKKDVITSLEFEEKLKKGRILTGEGRPPRHVAIIHCVGSRNKDFKPYCSRTCCATALKFANQVRSALPGADVFDIYADMRSFGKDCEELYLKTGSNGVMFLMYDQAGPPPEVVEGEDGLKYVRFHELLSGEDIEVPADMVVLMTAMEARADARAVARSTGISCDSNGFFMEKHPKLDPVATTTEGVYIAGQCQGPKGLAESVTQAHAAAARILATIERGSVEVEVITSHVNEEICCGCQTCISVCPYKAISFDEEKNVSLVNEILCKGCGTCSSTCPTGAIGSKHYTDRQILSQIEGLLSRKKPKKSLEEV